MSWKTALALVTLFTCCGVCRAQEQRWVNFAEDGDLKYYLDQKSIISSPEHVYLFWVKSVGKNSHYLEREYNVNGLSYLYTSYELDCAGPSYRSRGTIMFDRHQREIGRTLPPEDTRFQPVPPESLIELAEAEICGAQDDAPNPPGPDDLQPGAAAAPPVILETPASDGPEVPAAADPPLLAPPSLM